MALGLLFICWAPWPRDHLICFQLGVGILKDFMRLRARFEPRPRKRLDMVIAGLLIDQDNFG